MVNKTKGGKRDALWAEAKRRCRLNREDIRMAKEMGLNPRSLIKNIPSQSEPWKLPMKDWIHEMYRKRQEKAAKRKSRRSASKQREKEGASNTPARISMSSFSPGSGLTASDTGHRQGHHPVRKARDSTVEGG